MIDVAAALRAAMAADPSLITGGEAGQAQRDYLAGLVDDTRSWVDPRGYRLDDRIWLARQLTRQRIDDELRLAISRGENPVTVARRLEEYLNPGYTPRRDANGELVPGQQRKIVTQMPPSLYMGAGSYPARRLARTEITRAHGQATLQAASANPFVRGVRWALSNRHPKQDICNEHATRDEYGLGPGVYPPDQVPEYPSHPQELCTLAPVAMDQAAAMALIHDRNPVVGAMAANRPAAAAAFNRAHGVVGLLDLLGFVVRLLTE